MPALTLSEFLKLLPNIASTKSREMIGNGLNLFFKNGQFSDSIEIKGCTIYREDLSSLSIYGRVDAPAADTIIRLYNADALPMAYGKRPTSCPKAEAYVERARFAAAERIAERAFEKDRSIEERKAYDLKLANISSIKEEEFTLALLNDIFYRHHGPGGGTLKIGGIEVKKDRPDRYKDDDDLHSNWSYTYSWTSHDGTPHTLHYEGKLQRMQSHRARRGGG